MLYLHLDNVDNVFCVGRVSNFLSLSFKRYVSLSKHCQINHILITTLYCSMLSTKKINLIIRHLLIFDLILFYVDNQVQIIFGKLYMKYKKKLHRSDFVC